MKKSILLSMVLIVLSLAAIMGGTMAWFTDISDPIENVFVAGTVQIEADEVITGDVDTMLNWNPGDCVTKEFTITNTGTKSIALKGTITTQWYEFVEEEGTPGTKESIWNWGTKVSGTQTTGALARYFTYSLGQGSETEPVSRRLGIGQRINPEYGQVSVWDDDVNIYVTMTTTEPMLKADLYVSMELPTTTAPGQFGNKHEPASTFMTHTFIIPIGATTRVVSPEYYIMSHADITVGGSSGGEGSWKPWTPPTDNGVIITYEPMTDWTEDNGVFYYNKVIAGTFTLDEPVVVKLDAKVCFNKDVPNAYQGKKFILTATFEAIQASNDAPSDQWTDAPEGWKPTSIVEQ